jgi:hypothetical protein
MILKTLMRVKKTSVDVYSKEGVSSVRMQEENTIWEVNRTGKNESRGASKNDGCHI